MKFQTRLHRPANTAEPLDLQHRLTFGPARFRVQFFDLSAHHHRHYLFDTDFVNVAFSNSPPVAQDRHSVRHLLNFLDEMRYIYDAHAAFLQIPNQTEKILRVTSGQTAGWLVKHQNLAPRDKRLGYLYQLLCRRR